MTCAINTSAFSKLHYKTSQSNNKSTYNFMEVAKFCANYLCALAITYDLRNSWVRGNDGKKSDPLVDR